MERSFDRWLIGAVAVVVLLVGTASLNVRHVVELNRQAGGLTHTHEVILGLEQVLSLLKDAETGQRGYLITGDPRYLEPYHAAVKTIGAQVDTVGRLTVDNPRQQASLHALRERAATRMSILDEAIRLHGGGDAEGARQVILSDRGKVEMDAIRVLVAEMKSEESHLLAVRTAGARTTFLTAIATGIAASTAAIAGVVAFVLLLRRHLRARMAAATLLTEQHERLRTTLASIGDGVITTDAAGRVTNLNPVAESLTGWSLREAAGQPLQRVFPIVHQDTREPVPNPAERALREGLIVGLANHTLLIAKDGSERPIDDSAAPIKGADGNAVGCVLVFRDVTDRRQAEQAQREADRHKDEFLAILSHELRNPLAPLANALAVMKTSAHDPAALAVLQEVMERQLRHMVRLIDDLIDVSRISRGTLELRRGPVELASVVRQAVETARPVAEAAGHRLAVELPSEPVYLDGDPVRLAQVFANLLHNSCKFTPPGGRITVAAGREEEAVVVTVSDNGRGIPEDRLESIFGMFSQVDKSLERSQGGLGIGLALSRRLVELHGGTVEARSAGPGQGSAFRVRLPNVVEPPIPAAPPPLAPPAKFPSRRVLVVDDNRDSAESLAMLLSLEGHQTHTAHDGEEAVREAERWGPDVVLLDIGLPRLNGYDAGRRIRDLPGGKAMTLIALTGWGQDEDRRQSTDAGFDGHLVKPVDPDVLQALLARSPTV
jgi:PAS domain S-box-containing protein